jgi:hypothetical protein
MVGKSMSADEHLPPAVAQYQPRHDGLRVEVDALAAAYPHFLIPLTELIHSKSGSAGTALSGRFADPTT